MKTFLGMHSDADAIYMTTNIRMFWASKWLSSKCMHKKVFITSLIVLLKGISQLNHLCDNKVYFKLVQSYASKYESFYKAWKQFCAWKTKKTTFWTIAFWTVFNPLIKGRWVQTRRTAKIRISSRSWWQQISKSRWSQFPKIYNLWW